MHTCTLLKKYAAAHEKFTPHVARHDMASTLVICFLCAVKASGRIMVSIRDHDGAVKIFVAYAFLRAVSLVFTQHKSLAFV